MKKKSFLREWSEIITVAFVVALIVQTYVVKPFKIPSGSMENTLQVGDMIFVNRFDYLFKQPQRGDVVVFKYPENPKQDFVKRLIGLSGDTVTISAGKIIINGSELIEPYVKEPSFDNYGPVVVPSNSLLMLGDNRNNSRDSRYWGFLPESMIKGKAFLIYWAKRERNGSLFPRWQLWRMRKIQ
ncbi:MAG: signal peptidase I [bacterium]|nr:signal peptidase I [bacterium]